MELDHLVDVHAVDMIRPKDSDQIRRRILDQVQVLIYGVRRTQIPHFAAAHLGGHDADELVPQQPAEAPGLVRWPMSDWDLYCTRT